MGQIYWGDYKAVESGEANVGGMPGAVAAPLGAFIIGALGALLLLGVETGGEVALGVVDEHRVDDVAATVRSPFILSFLDDREEV